MSSRSQADEITNLLQAWRGGDETALTTLMPLVYRQLKDVARHLMRGQRGHDTLQPTVLVHEAYLRLIDLGSMRWQDRAHFFAMSARLMRHVLVDHARHQSRAKRGGGEPLITFDELRPASQEEPPHLLEIDEALRELAKHDAQKSQIVELRFFGGLNRDEIAEVLGISSATTTRRWRAARAWLIRYLEKEAR